MNEPTQQAMHFPWQRLVMTLIFDATLIYLMNLYVDWLYYLATLDPAKTSAAPAITALSAGAGVLFICFTAVQIWFITGSVRSLETMFRFNAATVAQSTMESVVQRIDERKEETLEQTLREFSTDDLKARYDEK